jgi:hypothetical protein
MLTTASKTISKTCFVHNWHYKSHPGDRIHSIFKELSPSQIVEDLHHQLEAFWRGEWPFDTPVKNGNSLAWWESLAMHRHARILAVSNANSLAQHEC